ncbi:MAG: hypothetical protein U0527_09485 [Candidatus Eisenbacteria bacterium]
MGRETQVPFRNEFNSRRARRSPTHAGVVVPAALALAALAGCAHDKGDHTTDAIQPPMPPGPQAVIDSLAAAASARDATAFVHWFDRDQYFFELSAADREGRPELPLGLDRATDSLAVAHLLASPAFDTLELNTTSAEVTEATDEDQLPGGPNGLWKVTVRNLNVTGRLSTSQRDSILTTGDGAEMFMRRIDAVPASALAFRIVRWRDLPRQTSAGDTVSFGLLKWRVL